MNAEIWVRNLTKDYDKQLHLPMATEELEKILGESEWIIVDDGWLKCGEFYHISKLNDELQEIEDNYVDEETVRVLLKVTYDFDEAIKVIEREMYTIIDFEEVTSGWNCGRGGDIFNDDDKGLALFTEIGYKPFDFEYDEDMENWIRWDYVWRSAESEGWQAVMTQNGNYLVHK